MANPSSIHFSIALEPDDLVICKPVDVLYEARLLSSSGTLLQSVPVKDGGFTLNVSAEGMTGKRLVFAPVNQNAAGTNAPATAKNISNAKDTRAVVLQPVSATTAGVTYEPVLPAKLADSNQLAAIPSLIWRYWCYCECRVRGRVFNECNGVNSPVYQARVHICEVERIWLWITRLPDTAILQIRDSLLNPAILQQASPIPPVGPGPVESIAALARVATAASDVAAAPLANVAALSVKTLPQENISALHTESVSLIREYLVQNYRVLFPWWCYWIPFYPWFWYTCIEETVVYTNEQGWFDTTIWYNCFDGDPDLYFWVEYNINGVWTTVYDPSIYCHTYWDYVCGTEVDIYLNDERVPCSSNPTTPGKVVVVTTLGNNANVNRVQQTTGAGEGLAPDLSYGYTSDGPFGGSVEPHVIFGEDLIPDGIKYYRWSYKLSTADDTAWATLTPSVDRHYFHINPDLSISFPVYNLGPKLTAVTPDLFEIQAPRNPLTNDPWAILDARADTATAYFLTNQLDNNDVALAAGLYDLKLELFDASGNQINLTDQGIGLLVPDPTQPAPFGNATVNTVAAPAINQILDGSGKLTGFTMVIRVDNNPTTAIIYETEVEGNLAGPCGFLVYSNKATSQAIVSYTASHPNGYAWYGFDIIKGSSGSVFPAGGPVPAVNPVTDTIPVATLLDGGGTTCTQAAFAENLDVYGTATDGWGRIGYDSSDSKAFALTDH